MRRHEDSYWWYRGIRELTGGAIRRYGTGGDLRLLDAGCGTGGQLTHLLLREDRVTRIVGVDLSMEAVRIAADRGSGDVLRASTMMLPFRDSTFDLVTSIDVLYIRGVDDRQAMSEMHRILKPGGLLVLNVPAYEMLRGRHDEAVHTRHRYRKSEVRSLLHDHGFGVVKLSYWNTTLFPVMMLKRSLERWSRDKPAPASDMSDLPRAVNAILTAVLRVENRVLLAAGLPFGASVFAVGARR